MQAYTTDTPAARSGRIKAEIAGSAVSSNEGTLTTSDLGSCIGVALYDPETGVSGLAHAMLPEAGDDSEPAKSVDTGVELLTAEVQTAGVDTDRIVARIVGGNTMFDFASADSDGSIGNRSVAATQTTPDGLGIDVIAGGVDDSRGRSLKLDNETGDPRVRSAENDTYIPWTVRFLVPRSRCDGVGTSPYSSSGDRRHRLSNDGDRV